MEPKYKVGDKVRIKVRTEKRSRYRCVFINDMASRAGTMCTVRDVSKGVSEIDKLPDDGYNYYLAGGGGWTYTSSMLEPAEEPKVLDFTPKKKHYQLNFSV